MNVARIEKRDTGWWVIGYECGPMGPYDTKAQADDDRRGVKRFYAKEDQPELFTGRKTCLPGQLDLFADMDRRAD